MQFREEISQFTVHSWDFFEKIAGLGYIGQHGIKSKGMWTISNKNSTNQQKTNANALRNLKQIILIHWPLGDFNENLAEEFIPKMILVIDGWVISWNFHQITVIGP